MGRASQQFLALPSGCADWAELLTLAPPPGCVPAELPVPWPSPEAAVCRQSFPGALWPLPRLCAGRATRGPGLPGCCNGQSFPCPGPPAGCALGRVFPALASPVAALGRVFPCPGLSRRLCVRCRASCAVSNSVVAAPFWLGGNRSARGADTFCRQACVHV